MYWESETQVVIHLSMQYIKLHIQLCHQTIEMHRVSLNACKSCSNIQDQRTRERIVVIYILDILTWQRFTYHLAFVRRIHASSPDYPGTGQ